MKNRTNFNYFDPGNNNLYNVQIDLNKYDQEINIIIGENIEPFSYYQRKLPLNFISNIFRAYNIQINSIEEAFDILIKLFSSKNIRLCSGIYELNNKTINMTLNNTIQFTLAEYKNPYKFNFAINPNRNISNFNMENKRQKENEDEEGGKNNKKKFPIIKIGIIVLILGYFLCVLPLDYKDAPLLYSNKSFIIHESSVIKDEYIYKWLINKIKNIENIQGNDLSMNLKLLKKRRWRVIYFYDYVNFNNKEKSDIKYNIITGYLEIFCSYKNEVYGYYHKIKDSDKVVDKILDYEYINYSFNYGENKFEQMSMLGSTYAAFKYFLGNIISTVRVTEAYAVKVIKTIK